MKATPSTDGEMRLTLRVVHRVNATTIIDALGWKLTRDIDFSGCQNKALRVESALKNYKSRAALIKVTTEAIAHEGAALWTWADQMDTRTVMAICTQAQTLVNKKFPALKLKKPTVNTPPAS